MRAPVFEAKLDVIASGLFPGMQQLSRPFWLDARDVGFDAFGAHARPGTTDVLFTDLLFDSASGLFDSASGPFDEAVGSSAALVSPTTEYIQGVLAQQLSDGTRRVAFASPSKIWFYSGSATPTEVASGLSGRQDQTSGFLASHMDLIPWGDWVIANNGEDAPKIYKSGPTFVALGGVTFTKAWILFKIGPYLVAANTNNGANKIEWSKDGDPELWDPVTYRTAGNLTMRDADGPFVCAAPLGQAYALYTGSQLYLLRRTDGISSFGAKLAVKGVGAVSKRSVVAVGPLNYGLYRDGIFRTDGSNYQVISYPAFASWLAENINFDQGSKIAGYHCATSKEVRWCVPLVSSTIPLFVISYNYLSGQFSFSNVHFSAAQESGVLPEVIVGRYNGTIRSIPGVVSSGESLSRYIQTKPLDFGRADAWKFVDQLEVSIAGTATVTVEVAALQDADDAVSFSVSGDVGAGTTRVNVGKSGVYFVFRFSSTGAVPWAVTNIRAYGVLEGGSV